MSEIVFSEESQSKNDDTTKNHSSNAIIEENNYQNSRVGGIAENTYNHPTFNTIRRDIEENDMILSKIMSLIVVIFVFCIGLYSLVIVSEQIAENMNDIENDWNFNENPLKKPIEETKIVLWYTFPFIIIGIGISLYLIRV